MNVCAVICQYADGGDVGRDGVSMAMLDIAFSSDSNLRRDCLDVPHFTRLQTGALAIHLYCTGATLRLCPAAAATTATAAR